MNKIWRDGGEAAGEVQKMIDPGIEEMNKKTVESFTKEMWEETF